MDPRTPSTFSLRTVAGRTIGLAVLALAVSGCVSQDEYNSCVNRNRIQMEQIASLEAALEAQKEKTASLEDQYQGKLSADSLWKAKAAALQKALDAKTAELEKLAKMMGQQVALPAELNNELAEWARKSGSQLVEYDEATGIVRFKSDLLFDKGSDTVAASVVDDVRELASILTSSSASGFDVLVVGHTDDIPIKKPETRAKHPTNWHLSAHRAIAVRNIFGQAGLAPGRTSVMGMGEYHPIAPNQPGNKGNPKNRRVEIYIVPAGTIQIMTDPGMTDSAD